MSIEKLQAPESPDTERLEALKALFPEVFADGRINLDALKEALPDAVEDDEAAEEHYGLTWPGKRAAKKLATLPPSGTLVPMPGEGVDEATTKNVIIEGDNLEVLRILQKSYAGRIKMIYIDPPYNTGQDFIYKDDFKEPVESYLRKAGQADEEGLLTSNPKASGRFHSNWLNMIYPRLKLARTLLRNNGVIFVSIDDNEQEHLLLMMNEIFGEENYVGTFIINATPNARDYGHIGKMHEYVHFYCKNIEEAETNQLEVKEKTFRFRDGKSGFNIHPLYNSNEAFTPENRRNLFFQIYLYPNDDIADCYVSNSGAQANCFFKIGLEKKPGSIEICPPKSEKNGVQFVWRWSKKKCADNFNIEIVGYKTDQGEYRIVQKMRHTTKIIRSIIDSEEVTTRRGTAEVEELLGKKIVNFPKPTGLIRTLIEVGTNSDDIVMDFFAGSGTTAHATLVRNQQDNGNRNFILVQLPEVLGDAEYPTIAHITRARTRKAISKLKKYQNFSINIQIDLGFRAYRLSPSNRTAWTASEGQTLNQLEDLFSGTQGTLKPGWKPADVLTEMMLVEGFPLDSEQTQLPDFADNQVWKITHPEIAHSLLVCLDATLQAGTVAQLRQQPKQDVLICLDSALDDQAKLALADALRVKTL